MLIEIPDPEVILTVIAAFLIGLLVFYGAQKIRPLLKNKERADPAYLERLELYERQLIDMKIRLDAVDLASYGTKFAGVPEPQPIVPEVPAQEEPIAQSPPKRASTHHKPQGVDNSNMVEYVLTLITHKSMTSRDIQKASHRSREHISRLMNRLFKEGLVERNTKTKPYSYSITDKGQVRIQKQKPLAEVPA